MKKSPVSGIAGAVRLDRLSIRGLSRAEAHGKRLDEISKLRRVADIPPVTSTGLDLHALYEEHVEDVFVPKANTKAIHMIVQFPKGLVDGADADAMLHHATCFAKRVFGDRAVFADRVDRDERSQHVVDLFIAPIYEKTTKHTAKDAVSTTCHLKALAAEHGYEKPTMQNGGRALQQAFYEYLRDEMGLIGVQRGSPKLILDDDWESAEQLREHEQAQLKAKTEQALADAERERAKTLAARAAMEAVIDRFEAEHEEAIVAANAREQAAAEKMEGAQAIRALADRAIEQTREERLQIDRDRQLHTDQLALLHRAVDDDSGLDLRLGEHPAGDAGFVMDEQKMTSRERLVYRQPWRSMIADIARRFARLLQKAHDAAASLLDRERAVEKQEAELAETKKAAARAIASERETQLKEHEAALAAIDEREAAVDARRAGAERLADQARTLFDHAEALGKAASEDVANNARWSRALEQIAESPSVITVDEEGTAAFVPAIAEQLGNEFLDTIASMATADANVPSWAVIAIERELEIAEYRHAVHQREREAAEAFRQLNAVLRKAGPILTPAQEVVARESRSIMRGVAAVSQRGRDI